MLKQEINYLIKVLSDEMTDGNYGIDTKTRLILAFLMTNTLSRLDTVSSKEVFLSRVIENYRLLNDVDILERICEKNPNFVEKD